MKRIHYAILIAEVLSYALIVTFIFADTTFDLTESIRISGPGLSREMAITAGCMVALVGSINVWLTVYYMQKSQTLGDWIVLCAWTHRVKSGDRWMKLEDFLAEQLGCQVSHGMSADAFNKLSSELDTRWRDIKSDASRGGTLKPLTELREVDAPGSQPS